MHTPFDALIDEIKDDLKSVRKKILEAVSTTGIKEYEGPSRLIDPEDLLLQGALDIQSALSKVESMRP